MKNIFDTVGNTPLIRLFGFEKNHGISAHVFAKLEFFNPFGSIKDRAAKQILYDAQHAGSLGYGMTVLEATSGNMGISLSAMARLMGYRAKIIMPENASEQRKKIIASLGAELVLTDKNMGMRGAMKLAEQLSCDKDTYFYARQFENRSSIIAHKKSTAPEIETALDGNADAVICGIGSGGTAMGLAKYFAGGKTKIYGVEPSMSPFLTCGRAGTHRIQGIGAGFLPKILDTSMLDGIIAVNDNAAFERCDEVLSSDGVYAGLSSGAVLEACLKICEDEQTENKNIVLIFADGGERYL